VALGTIDFALRIADPGIRLMLTSAVVVVLAVAGWRWLVLPLRSIPNDVLLARRLIEREQRIGEELPTAVEFLKQSEDDRLAGSIALRRAVIIEATGKTEGLAWQRFADRALLRRAACVALLPALFVASLAIWRPTIVAVGAA
jgi:hypothetical protein